jgi:hypothetical protein
MTSRFALSLTLAARDDLRYLERMQVQGLTRDLGGRYHVSVRPGSTRADVIHEWLHVVRNRAGYPMGGGEDAWINAWLGRHSKLLKLD